MKLSDPNTHPTYSARLTITILLVSLLLRWTLVLRGGQYYFSDEQRYQVSRQFVDSVFQGRLAEAFSGLFTAPEHLGFKIIGILPAMLEKLTQPSLIIPALFFSLFSVLNLYLIFLLSQRAGASPDESMLALGIAAASQSLLYYARHLMPYDTAMTFGLLSLVLGLKKGAGARTSLLCGALGFLCFLTYNGYWTLAGFALLSHLFSGEGKPVNFLQRGMLLATGCLIPLVLLMLAARASGINLLLEYANFAGTVTQGDYTEGWSLPFEYFWHTEHFLIIVLALLSLYAVIGIFKNKERNQIRWLAGIFFVYVCLAVFSVYFHSFVVLGRLARQIMPFLILLAAHGMAQIRLLPFAPRYATGFVMAVILLQGLWNYGNSFRLSYPKEFSRQAQIQFTDFKFSEKRMAFGAPALCEHNGYVMENAKYFLQVPEVHSEIQEQVLLSRPHPVNFLPYQYEGYPPKERREFRERNLQMNLYKVHTKTLSDTDPVLKNIRSCVVRD